jgi:hypothetical protein
MDKTGIRELLFFDVPWGWKRTEKGYTSGVANFCSRTTRRVLRAETVGDFHHRENLDNINFKVFCKKMESVDDEHLEAIENELRDMLSTYPLPLCFSDEKNECSASACVVSNFMMNGKHAELLGEPACFFQQRKLVIAKNDRLQFLYYAFMFSIRLQNIRNKMAQEGYNFDDIVAHKDAIIASNAESVAASPAKNTSLLINSDFLALCGICGDDSGIEDVLASDSIYSQKNSIERIDSRSKFKFMASGGAKGWILREDVRVLLAERLEQLEARHIKQHVKFLIVHPHAEFYDKVKRGNNPKKPPQPDCYREWYKLLKRFGCLEVKLYQMRTFRLQIEKDRVLVSRYEEEIKKGKPAIIIWDSNPKSGAWIDNSLYKSFDMLFDLIWDMDSTCGLEDFFENQGGEAVLQELEKEFDY